MTRNYKDASRSLFLAAIVMVAIMGGAIAFTGGAAAASNTSITITGTSSAGTQTYTSNQSVTFQASGLNASTSYTVWVHEPNKNVQYFARLNQTTFSTSSGTTSVRGKTISLPPSRLPGTYRLGIASNPSSNTYPAANSSNFTVDNSPPSVSVTQPSGGETIKGGSSYTIKWTAYDYQGLASSPFSLSYSTNDGRSWTSKSNIAAHSTSIFHGYAYGWAVPNGIDSSQVEVKLTAADKAGNTNSSTSSTFTVDSSKPNATISSPTSTSVALVNGSASLQVSYNATDVGPAGFKNATISIGSGSVSKTITSTSNASGTVTFTSTDLSQLSTGTYDVHLTAYDNAGNMNSSTQSGALQLDKTGPNATITSPTSSSPAYTNASGPLQVSYNATDVGPAGFKNATIAIGNSTTPDIVNTTTTSAKSTVSFTSQTLSTLSPGTYNVRLTAYDNVNNTNSATQTNALVIDTAKPNATITSPTSNSQATVNATGSLTVSYNATDVGQAGFKNATVTVGGVPKKITSSANATGTVTFTSGDLSSLSPGTYNVGLVAYDNAGNRNSTTQSSAVVVDNAKPNATITSPTATSQAIVNTTGSLTVSYNATAVSPAGFKNATVSIGSVSKMNTTAPTGTVTFTSQNLSYLSAGTYDVHLRAYDTAGNTNSSTQSTALKLANAKPNATILTPTSSSPAYTNATGSLAVTYNATAVSPAGFKNATIAIGNSTTPDIVNTTTSSATGTVTFTSQNLSTLSPGAYTVRVTAYDTAGNMNSSTQSGALVIDTAKPNATLTSPTAASPALVNATGSLTVSYNATDVGLAGFKNATVSIGNVSKNITSSANATGTVTFINQTLSNLSTGTYDVHLTAYDNAGNTNSSTASNALKLASTKPNATLTSPTANSQATVNATGSLTVSYNATAVSPAGFKNATVSVGSVSKNITSASNATGTVTFTSQNLSQLSPGIYNVSLTAYDNASNMNSSTQSTALKLANAKPNATLTGPTSSTPAYENATGSLTVSYNASAVSPAGFKNATVSIGSVSKTITSSANATGTVTFTHTRLSTLSSGAYNVTLTTYDTANNTNSSTQTNALVIDTAKPDATITGPTSSSPALVNATGPLQVSYNATDVGQAGFKNATVSVGGVSQTTITAPTGSVTFTSQNLSTLSPGVYNVSVTTYDHAGNMNSSTQLHALKLANAKPNATLTGPTSRSPATVNATGSLTVSYNATAVNPAGFKNATVSIGGVSKTNSTAANGTVTFTSQNLSTLSPGTYNVSLTTSDNASNTNSSTASNALKLANAKPNATITRPTTGSPARVNATGSLTVHYNATAVGPVAFRNATVAIGQNGTADIINATNTSASTGTVTFTSSDLSALSPGVYNVTLTTSDNASNTNSSTQSNALRLANARISNIAATTNHGTVTVSFSSTKKIKGASVNLSSSQGNTSNPWAVSPVSTTVDHFSATEHNGMYTYTATYNASRDGQYTLSSPLTTDSLAGYSQQWATNAVNVAVDQQTPHPTHAEIVGANTTLTAVVVQFNEPISSSISPANVSIPNATVTRVYSGSANQGWIGVIVNGQLPTGNAPQVSIDSNAYHELYGDGTAGSQSASPVINTGVLRLHSGKNFVSVPAAAGSLKLSQVNTTNVDMIWSYQNGRWLKYRPGGSNNGFNALAGGQGYIFVMNSSATMRVNVHNTPTGSMMPNQQQLSQGWNLVGTYQDGRQNASTAFSSMQAQGNNVVFRVLKQTAGSHGYDYTSVASNQWVYPGHAYWVYTTSATKYTEAPFGGSTYQVAR